MSPVPASPNTPAPASQSPTPARVRWDGRGLEIHASNASLNDILHQVVTLTGATLEGAVQDQRIFGNFGPGPGCTVLSDLLAGSGDNVLMLGNPSTGAPLKIVLSVRSLAPVTSARSQQADANRQQDESAPPPSTEAQRDTGRDLQAQQPPQDPFSNGAPTPTDRVQFMEEILQRQQKIDQQQADKAPQQ